MNLKIYVVGHKKFKEPKEQYYNTIQVGNSDTFSNIRDNTGENISSKNRNFCELTALYWIWKNDLDSHVIGLNHYRRYFDFKEIQSKSILLRKINYSDIDDYVRIEKEFHWFEKFDVILPKPEIFPCTVYEQYKLCHNINDMEIIKQIITSDYPDYLDAFNKVMNGHKAYIYNMFIMKRETFSIYMSWLFDILFEAEKKIQLTGDTYQDRVFGFLAERLLNVFITKQRMRIKEVPTIFIDPDITSSEVLKERKKVIIQRYLHIY